MARFSARDAERLPEYEARLEAVAAVLRALVLETPPNLPTGGWLEALPEPQRVALEAAARRVRSYHEAQ